jgi:phosphate transport system substrate-binding protein
MVKGSDTMVILAQTWAETFMRTRPRSAIQVSGGGSGTGLAALVNGTTDLANSSRQIKESERAQIRAERGAEVVETKVALDALAVYVHDENPIRQIDLPTLASVYRGRITNWSELGGADAPIVLYSRENNSGTYAYFKENVLKDYDFAPETQTLPGTAAVLYAVSHDPNAIGYGGIAFGAGIRTLAVRAESGEYVLPSLDTATSGDYPLARFLFVYTAGEPRGLALDFLSWVVSPEGQGVVTQVGYFPMPHPAEGP